MAVEHGKIGHDDGYWKSNRKDSCQSTQSSNQHAHISFRSHITVSNRRHCYNGPPKTFWYTLNINSVIKKKTTVKYYTST